MQLSKKAEYAVRAVAILCSQGPDNSMQAREMAQLGDIPLKFLEQILLILKRNGLVISKRGVGGGYRIGREPRLLTVAEVVESIEGEICPLADLNETPDFPGASGIVDCLSTATSAYLTHLQQSTFEDLLNHESGDSMVGFGI